MPQQTRVADWWLPDLKRNGGQFTESFMVALSTYGIKPTSIIRCTCGEKEFPHPESDSVFIAERDRFAKSGAVAWCIGRFQQIIDGRRIYNVYFYLFEGQREAR